VVGVKVLTIAVNLGCAGLIFFIGGNLFGRRVGAWAALFFSCAAVTGIVEDFAAPNTEIYANLFVLGSLAVLIRNLDRPSRRALVACGFLGGVAVLYRLQGGAALLGTIAFLARRHRVRLPLLRATGWIGIGFALPVAAAIATLAARGTLGDFWLWAVRDNLSYVRLGAAHFGWRPLARIALVGLSQLPLVAAAVATGAAWLRTREPERARLELIWLHLLAALLAYQMGTRFYGHYFLPVVPALSLIAAWGYVNLPRARLPWLRFLPYLPHLLVLWLCAFALTNTIRMSTSQEDRQVADAVGFIKAASRSGDEIFLWGAPGTIAFESDRVFATRFPFNNYLTGRIFGTDHSLPGATRAGNRALESAEGWRLLADDLATSRPAFIVDGRIPDFELGRYPLLRDYLLRFYDPAVRFGSLAVYRLARPMAR
jgi:4-amino-4-deoxy-L-arabinose transferase-like glycosyltransferase